MQGLLVRVALGSELWLGRLRCMCDLGRGVGNPVMGALLLSLSEKLALSDLCGLRGDRRIPELLGSLGDG